MRYRDITHTVTPGGNVIRIDLRDGGSTTVSAWSKTIVDMLSLMWDDPSGGKGDKPCIHLGYTVGDVSGGRHAYHSSDTSNTPSPRYEFIGDPPYGPLQSGALQPSTLIANAGSYISVSSDTSDDIGSCISNAYNQYVNSVRALDASTSLAESGETPRLFELWQRRLSAPANLVNGFLGYSFGWRPLISDLKAVAKELRAFPKTVRRRLKSIGDGFVVRHYQFNLDHTVDAYTHTTDSGTDGPLPWQSWNRHEYTVTKSRMVRVTIRSKVKPKLTGDGQVLLNKLGALGLIPSLATVWRVSKLSFVVDWFYNIGGAIENLQGSLTHDISDVHVCVSDLRTRTIRVLCEDVGGPDNHVLGNVEQRSFTRSISSVPLLPVLRKPSRVMPYVLLGLLGLTHTKVGGIILNRVGATKVSKAVTAKINAALDALSPRKRAAIIDAYTKVIPRGLKKTFDNSQLSKLGAPFGFH